MKTVSRLLAVLLLCALPLSLTACQGSGLTDTEIRAVFEDLTLRADPLTVAFYGDGLAPMEKADAIARMGIDEADFAKYLYLPVSADAPFQSEDELRAATLAVFSPEMAALLLSRGFDGVRTDDDELLESPRYIQRDGFLTVRRNLAENAYEVDRDFDFEEMTVLLDEADRIRIEVPSSIGGEPSVSVRLTAVLSKDGLTWLLDSPTY